MPYSDRMFLEHEEGWTDEMKSLGFVVHGCWGDLMTDEPYEPQYTELIAFANAEAEQERQAELAKTAAELEAELADKRSEIAERARAAAEVREAMEHEVQTRDFSGMLVANVAPATFAQTFPGITPAPCRYEYHNGQWSTKPPRVRRDGSIEPAGCWAPNCRYIHPRNEAAAWVVLYGTGFRIQHP